MPPARPASALRRFVTRTTLLYAWTFVLWGTVVFVAVLFGFLQEGLPALRRLDPRTQPGLLPWINAGAAVLAPAVWLLVVTAVVLARRKPVPR
jgi:hypothetical protein